jgi:predicted RNase H-like HicB family nuclease
MLSFKLEPDEDKWHAYCPQLPGCHTFGATPKDALENLKDAINLYIEDEMEKQSLESLISSKEKIYGKV